MPLPDRDASSYGSRARRHYRRFRITRPVSPDSSPWDAMPLRSSASSGDTKPPAKLGGYLWLLIVLAITVFTFICLILMVVGVRWLVSSP